MLAGDAFKMFTDENEYVHLDLEMSGLPGSRKGAKLLLRRSKVVISSAKPEDSGRYECVAESTSGHRASLAAQLLVAHDTRIPETTTAAWPRQEQPCPIAGDFCMNGGTCLFFETVGEPACRCAEGFTGLRCETKDVISTGIKHPLEPRKESRERANARPVRDEEAKDRSRDEESGIREGCNERG
ncbi:hypothetical protein KM043_017933 [Ampulex compressa]|nr:hypothetical protein KM043_017933 [Ampulex compressa]